jgi:hypothetical protein
MEGGRENGRREGKWKGWGGRKAGWRMEGVEGERKAGWRTEGVGGTEGGASHAATARDGGYLQAVMYSLYWEWKSILSRDVKRSLL